MVAAERDVPGNTAARSWASPTTTAVSQVMSGPERAAAHRPLDDEDGDAADQGGPRDGRRLLGQGESELLERSARPRPVMTKASTSLAT